MHGRSVHRQDDGRLAARRGGGRTRLTRTSRGTGRFIQPALRGRASFRLAFRLTQTPKVILTKNAMIYETLYAVFYGVE